MGGLGDGVFGDMAFGKAEALYATLAEADAERLRERLPDNDAEADVDRLPDGLLDNDDERDDESEIEGVTE